MTTNREIRQGEDDAVPVDAIPLQGQDAEAISTQLPGEPVVEKSREEQIGIAREFVAAMAAGKYEEALVLADRNWILCRIMHWLWQEREAVGGDASALDRIAESMLENRSPEELWTAFVRDDRQAFLDAWGSVDVERLGVASRRREIGNGYELVIFVPVGNSGGYFVTGPTAVKDALPITMHDGDKGWRVPSHLGAAPPQPGWPPSWWAR